MKFHLTEDGPKRCTATKKPCPLGASPEEHYANLPTATAAYEAKMSSDTLTTMKSRDKTSVTSTLLRNGSRDYPAAVLKQLGEYLESRPYKPLVVIPAGSQLYNSSVPGRALHDYDFTVFATPHRTLKKSHQHLSGELDVNTVGVDKIQTLARRSAPLSEAFYAYKSGRSLAVFDDPKWGPYTSSIQLPVSQYYDLLDDCVRSTSHEFTEPATQDDKKNFHNFKHSLRWQIYQKRWGSEGPPVFDPRFTDEERELFKTGIEEGSTGVVWR